MLIKMLTETQKYNQGHNYSIVDNKRLKARALEEIIVCACIHVPANSPGFPRSLQVFHQISWSPRAVPVRTPKPPGKNLPWPIYDCLF